MIWRALSIRQPWAWLVVNGFKPVENRERPLNYRGPLLIHAGKTMTIGDYNACVLFCHGIDFEWHKIPPPEELERGGIVGKVKMVDCRFDIVSPWFCGPYGYIFDDAEPLPFYSCKGTLGLFSVELHEAVAA